MSESDALALKRHRDNQTVLKLYAERDRYREALLKIRDADTQRPEGGLARDAVRIAREALTDADA